MPLLKVLVVPKQDQGLHLQGEGGGESQAAQAPQKAVCWTQVLRMGAQAPPAGYELDPGP